MVPADASMEGACSRQAAGSRQAGRLLASPARFTRTGTDGVTQVML